MVVIFPDFLMLPPPLLEFLYIFYLSLNSFLLTSFCLLYCIICNISVEQQAGLLAALMSSPMINAARNDGDREGCLGFSRDVEFGSPVGITVSVAAPSVT